MNTAKPYPKMYILFKAEEAEEIAAALQESDGGWKYKAVHDPKGTGHSFIEIYDEADAFVGRY